MGPGAVQFKHLYNEIAEPFDWTFTSADLTELMNLEPPPGEPLALA